MIQGGDVENGDGTGSKSIYGAEFDDENLDWRELDAAGLICSANRGKNTNGSQFFITLDACPHLNGKHTIFGRLVSGEEVVKQIARVAVDDKDRPLEPVLIARCGELARKERAKRDSRQENAAPVGQEGDDRGRRRKSDLSDDEMDALPPPTQRRARRQSDNIVDEGKRGRPRARSRSRSKSNSQPLEEVDEPVSDSSSVKLHKRKRSQSPSRHVDRRSDDAESERRRRSLPNQYNNHRDRDRERYRGQGDEDRYRPSPRRDGQRYPGRQDNNSRYRSRYADDGRLGGGDDDGRLGGGDSRDDNEPAVKYKGRGAMKFREPDRAW